MGLKEKMDSEINEELTLLEKAYPEAKFQCINKDNYLDFILS